VGCPGGNTSVAPSRVAKYLAMPCAIAREARCRNAGSRSALASASVSWKAISMSVAGISGLCVGLTSPKYAVCCWRSCQVGSHEARRSATSSRWIASISWSEPGTPLNSESGPNALGPYANDDVPRAGLGALVCQAT
jgi:hypothetical protein